MYIAIYISQVKSEAGNKDNGSEKKSEIAKYVIRQQINTASTHQVPA